MSIAAFEIERVKGRFTFPHVIRHQDVEEIVTPTGLTAKKVKNRYETVEREADEAFMVYFPQGHSLCIAVDDKAQLQRLGLTHQAEAADMSELLPQDELAALPKTPKQIVQARMTKAGARQTVGMSDIERL